MSVAAPTAPGDVLSKEHWRQDYVEKAQKYYEHVAKARVALPEKLVEVEHSGPQGKVKPFTIIDDPADWKRSNWVGREAEYTYLFTPEDLFELTAAVDALKNRGVVSEDHVIALNKADFALPNLGPKLVDLAKDVTFGRGFQLLKSFPVDMYRHGKTDYNYDKEGEIYGSILNHITVGRHSRAPGSKGAPEKKDTVRLAFHSDQGATDIISLLSLNNGKEGGISKWVSSIAIHNELLRRGRKDLVEELAKPWNVPRKINQYTYERDQNGELIKEPTIPFEYHDGYLSVYYQSNNYQEVEKQLTPLQEEAIWAVAALAEDPEFHFAELLEPGTIEWIHNPSIFHSRAEVIDGETNDTRRYLLRFWVDTEANNRPIAPTFAPRSSVQERGGFKHTPGATLRLPLVSPSRPDALD